jgi:hypothetical protein
MKREDFDSDRPARLLQPVQSPEIGMMTPGVDYFLNKIPNFAFDMGIVVQTPKEEPEPTEAEPPAPKHGKRAIAKETFENPDT